MKITLLIPVFNEVDGITVIMPRIKKEWVDQILIVDGGSTDGTYEYYITHGYEVVRQKEKGIRYAYIEFLDKIRGDVVITFSPDGNSIPELIPALTKKIKDDYDMVIVSRYYQNAKSYDDDAITRFGNWLFTKTINLLYGSHYSDSLVMYRAWKKSVFYALDLDKNESYLYAEKVFFTKIGIEPLLSIRAAKRKLRCCDIPGDEPTRIGGQRKLKVFRWGAAYMLQVLREKFYWK